MHQARGGFGFSPPSEGTAWQALRWGVVDVEQAFAESAEFRDLLWKHLRWPDAPPWSGGMFDWPARDSDALAFAKREWRLVQAYLRSLEA